MSYPSITFAPPSTGLPYRYAHTIEYFSKGIDEGGPYYRVNYLIDSWSNSDAMVNALLGLSTITGDTSTGTVVKRGPHQHPLSPNLFCRRAEARGLGAPILGADGYPNFAGGATIEAEYRAAVPYDYSFNANSALDPGTPLLYCTQELDLTTESFLIPANKLQWVNNPAVLPYPFRLQVPVAHLMLTFHKLPYIPMAAARALRGRVNLTTFLGAPAGCVLFKSARVVRDWSADGSVVQKVLLTFAERDPTQQWNWMPQSNLTWAAVQSSTGKNPPYPSADLSPLVQL